MGDSFNSLQNLGGCLRGITQLYAEMMLLAVVLSLGATLSYVAAGTASALKDIRLPPKVSACRVGDAVVIANWGDRPFLLRVVCADDGTYVEVEAGPGASVLNMTCSDVVVTYYDYVIRPTRVR